jgi:AmmeMemoRadiSam system protein B
MAAVAGRFYEGSRQACREQVEDLLPQALLAAELPGKIVAGIVPHAGWTFSGALAALVFAAVKQRQPVDTFVIFGAVHMVRTNAALLYDAGQWGTPLGTIDIDEELAEAIGTAGGQIILPDRNGHSREHSIEVQVPFIQHLFPEAALVPILVPPVAHAPRVGEAVAQVLSQTNKRVVCIASTDLTHYGPSYGYTPRGTGPEAMRWAKEENDRFFLDLALAMQAEKLVEAAQMYGNACGAGAVAAAVAAAGKLGATKGYLLAHTTSAEVMAKKYRQRAEDSVGYAAVVFG